MKSDMVKSFVIAMLLLQAIATACLWILNVLSVETTGVFAVLLAANLIAFAVVLQEYRNPDTIYGSMDKQEPPSTLAPPPPPPVSTPAPAPVQATTQVSAAPAEQANHSEPMLPHEPVGPALPRSIHTLIPIASIILLLAFAAATFLPASKSTLPVESTVLFIPIYLVVVVILVFGAMYLFKRLMDTEDDHPTH